MITARLTWTSYYARPKTYVHGGVNESRLQWCLFLSEQFDVSLVNAKNGYTVIGSSKLKYVEMRHLFKSRIFMIPIDFRKISLGRSSVVQLHEGWTLSAFMMSLACLITNTRYIVTPHGVYEPGIVKHLKFLTLRKPLERFVLKHAHMVHLFFESEKEGLNQICKDARTVIAPTGLNDFKTDAEWIGGGKYILYFGRIDVEHKGIDILLEAFHQLKSEHRLLIVGSGSHAEEKKMTEQIKTLGLQNQVILVSYQSRRIVETLIVHSEVVVLPSRWEAFGRGIMESVSTGAPTIITNQMRIAKNDFLKNMVTVVPACSTNLNEALYELLEELHDSKKQKNEFNRIASEEGSWNTSIGKFLAAL